MILGIIFIKSIRNKENNENFIIENIDNTNVTEDNMTIREEKTMIKVHIDGEIKNRGVIELEEGSRLVDAIEKAGGFTEESDTSNLNLAYVLQDGEKIYIYSKEEMKKIMELRWR